MVNCVTPSRVNRLLAGVQVLAIGGAGLIAWMAFLAPDSGALPDNAPSGDSTYSSETLESADRLPSLATFAPLWQRDLRQPPIPPATPEPTPPSTPAPPRLPKLLGTFLDDEGRWAQLAGPRDRPRMARVNEKIGKFTVASIEPGRLELRYRSQSYWIEIERPAKVVKDTR